eukprot:2332346-Alexandrium_andersonii.AAC.1
MSTNHPRRHEQRNAKHNTEYPLQRMRRRLPCMPIRCRLLPPRRARTRGRHGHASMCRLW